MTSRIWRLFAAHACQETGTTVACGHNRSARAVGIAEVTPNLRTS